MQKRTYYILFASIFFFLSSNKVISQYRDPFSEKRKRPSIKKNNNMGLLHAKTFFKRQNDSFTNYKRQNGVIGIDNDPFKITGNLASERILAALAKASRPPDGRSNLTICGNSTSIS